MFLLGELKKCDLLRPLTDDQLEEMVAVAKRREIKKTEFIIKEDEDGKEIFVLENGRIGLLKISFKITRLRGLVLR